MADSIYHWIKNLVFYYIFLSIVMHFLPDNHYKKYVRFFMGIILITILLTPIWKLLNLENGLNQALNQNQLKSSYGELKGTILYTNKSQAEYLADSCSQEIEQEIKAYLEKNENLFCEVTVILSGEDSIKIEKINISLNQKLEEEQKMKIQQDLATIYQMEVNKVEVSD